MNSRMLISARKRVVELDPCFSAAAQHNSKAYDSFDSILPGLPDDIAMICLAHVPRKHLIVMGAVCKRWRSFIQSKEFDFVRKETGMLEEWLYFFTTGFKGSMMQWEVKNSAGVEVWRIPPMPGSVDAGFGTVVLDGKLLIIGGYSKKFEQSVSDDVYQYDARLNRWSMLAKMNVARYNFACSEINGLIYAVGGNRLYGYRLSAAEVYDPNKNNWTLIEKLPHLRHSGFGCSLGGKLYVMGGTLNYGFSSCSHVDVYIPDNGSWCQLKNGISDSVTTHAVLGKKLFCVLWRKKVISIFDPADNSWTKLEIPFTGISVDNIQLGILYNKLLLFSLRDDPDYRTMVYDPAAPPDSQWCRSEIRASEIRYVKMKFCPTTGNSIRRLGITAKQSKEKRAFC